MSLNKPKKFRFYILMAVGLSLATINSTAQTQKVNIEHIPGANGISLGKINAITQDNLGFMWFSDQTNAAIVRYDGSFMKRFQHDPGNPNSLGGYYPECLYAEDSGIIWIGFYGQGLDRFDPFTNTFTHYRHNPDDPSSLAHDFVTAVLKDHLGNVWVGTYGGLDLLDPESGTFTHFSYQKNDPTSLSCNTIRALYEDKSGTIWVGTGFAYDQIDEGGLNRLDRDTGTFTRYMHDPDDPKSLINDKVRAIFEDSKGNFWVGTKGDGLHTMDRKTGAFIRHTYDATDSNKLSRPALNGPYDHITFIIEDSEQHIWIGTNSGGINRYDPASKTITHFGKATDDNPTFTDNSGWCAYATEDGLVWLNTEQAPKLYLIDIYANSIPFIANDGWVTDYYEETPAIHWIGTDNGLVRKDLEKGTSQKFLHNPDNPNTLSSNRINRMTMAQQGYLWISTFNGLNKLDPYTGAIKRFLPDPNDSTSIANGDVSMVYEDADLNMWVATLGGGLDLLDRETGKFKHFRHNPADISTIGSDLVNGIVTDDANNFWVGSENNGGIGKLNRQTNTFDRYLPGLSIRYLYVDEAGTLWVGSRNGLYRYDIESDNFLDTEINFNVASMVSDNQNNLWVATSVGLINLDQEREHSILYGEKNGVQGLSLSNVSLGAHKLKDGNLFFGSVNGYYLFEPEKLKIPKGTTNLYFTDLVLNGTSVMANGKSPLKAPIYLANDIQLDHNQNVFSLSFTSIDYRKSDDHVLYYMLENYDNDWRIGKAEDPVTYFKVPPGEYTFKIKAANSANGLWTEKNIKVLIAPPWYTTWWAFILYACIFLAVIYAVHRFQKDRLLKKERERTRAKELAQAKEIEKAYTTLKATQNQLIHSEKMASLGELTAGIAHEIKNPLNFVNNFSEVNKELLGELKEELEKGNTKEVQALMTDVINNEEKIIFHGKRADSIVRGMLQHSRSSNGVKEPTDINALCDEYLRLAYHGLRAKDKTFNATMHTDFDSTIGTINIIPQDIGRVVLNLLTNAFYAVSEKSSAAKASEKTKFEPTVAISTKKIGKKVDIRVTDNGNGIPEKVKEKIFQPFFTTKPTGEGTGLGLSMSYDIVTKGHGGKLKVDSEEGIGTTFTISLPLAQHT